MMNLTMDGDRILHFKASHGSSLRNESISVSQRGAL